MHLLGTKCVTRCPQIASALLLLHYQPATTQFVSPGFLFFWFSFCCPNIVQVVAKFLVLLIQQSFPLDFRSTIFKDDRFLELCTISIEQMPHVAQFLVLLPQKTRAPACFVNSAFLAARTCTGGHTRGSVTWCRRGAPAVLHPSASRSSASLQQTYIEHNSSIHDAVCICSQQQNIN